MKKAFAVFLFSVQVFTGAGQPTDRLYAQTIYVSPGDDATLKVSVEDLRTVLHQVTGKPFRVLPFDAKAASGIFLTLLDRSPQKGGQTLPAAGSIEGFLLAGNNRKLTIEAIHPVGLSRGIYSYLDDLGVKWYLPGEAWTVVPSRTGIVFNGRRYTTPSFVLRNFFGTGDIAFLPSLDPDRTLLSQWQDWKRRNRMGGEYEEAGHYGETFNINHRETLVNHPEYLALQNGKRQWSVSAKWCISNKELRRLFIADRVAALTEEIRRRPDSNEKILLSVDPSDGGGDCECEACKKLGTVSDRDFFLANETVKELQKISPRAYANIFAYNTHAAPPRFALDTHLVVHVVPYAFQDVGTPEQMISLWKKAHTNLLMYDYYGTTDWHWNTPLAGPAWGLATYIAKVHHWRKSGYRGFLLESSFSSMSTGPGLYLMGRLGWNEAENVTTVESRFYDELFGPAAAPVHTFFKKIMTDYKGAADLPYLLSLLTKADDASPDGAVQRRLAALKSYVHYLVLYYRQLQNPDSDAFKNEFYDYTMGTYASGIVQSTRIAELLMQQQPAGSPLREAWSFTNASGRLSSVKPVTAETIAAQFRKDRAAYPLQQGFHYEAQKPAFQYTVKDKNNLVQPAGDGLLLLDWPETYVRPSDKGGVVFFLKVNETSEHNDSQRYVLQLVDTATGQTVLERQVTINRNWQAIRLSAPPKKTYRLISKHTNWIRLSVPEGQWMAFSTIPTYAVMGRLWFYNQPGSGFLYYENTAKEQPVFTDAKNTKAVVEKVNELGLYKVNLQSGSGAWWSIGGAEYKFLRFQGAKPLFFLSANLNVEKQN